VSKVIKTISLPDIRICIYDDMTMEISDLETQRTTRWTCRESMAIYDTLRSLCKTSVYATIEGVGYGMRDFRDGKPGLWFGTMWGDGLGSLQTLQGDELTCFLVENNIHNIKDLNGRKCLINEHENGHIDFLGLV
jgi:hypothetical protein